MSGMKRIGVCLTICILNIIVESRNRSLAICGGDSCDLNG